MLLTTIIDTLLILHCLGLTVLWTGYLPCMSFAMLTAPCIICFKDHVYCHAQCQCDPCLSTGVLWCLWSVCIVTLSVSVTPVCLQECCGACGQCVLSRSVSV